MLLPKFLRGKQKLTQEGEPRAAPASSVPASQPPQEETDDEEWDLEAEDLVIVMGVTGSGKSYFVNQLQSGSVLEGHGLRSQTKICQLVQTKIGRSTVAMIDTPGFDDDEDSDAEILATITKVLTTQYRIGIRLKGIIYLHRINDTRFSGSAKRYLEVFREICGSDALRKVALVSTMWDQVSRSKGLQHDVELQNDHWGSLTSKGSLVFQYDGSQAMAETIVGQLVTGDDIILKIQRELCDNHLPLDQTAAGVIINSKLAKRMAHEEEMTERLTGWLENAENASDRKEAIHLRGQLREQNRKRNKLQKARKDLESNIDMETSERIKEAKARKKSRGERWKSRLELFGKVIGPMIGAISLVISLAG